MAGTVRATCGGAVGEGFREERRVLSAELQQGHEGCGAGPERR